MQEVSIFKTINVPVSGHTVMEKEGTGLTWSEIIELGVEAGKKSRNKNIKKNYVKTEI